MHRPGTTRRRPNDRNISESRTANQPLSPVVTHHISLLQAAETTSPTEFVPLLVPLASFGATIAIVAVVMFFRDRTQRMRQETYRGLPREGGAHPARAPGQAKDVAQRGLEARSGPSGRRDSVWLWRCQYAGKARFSTWLCQIGYYAFLADRERPRPRTVEHDSDLAEPALAVEHEEPDSRALLRHDLERAFAHLSSAERDALALTFGQDMTHDEAAHILGCPLGTLKTHVSRGLSKLQGKLLAWGASGDSTTARGTPTPATKAISQ